MRSRYTAISFHATAVLYTGGTVAQLLKLLIDFPWIEMPFLIDWLIVFLGSIGAVGLIWFHRSIAYRGLWEQVVHWVIVLHLLSSVVLHICTIMQGDHEFYASFPREYSYFAVLYFGLFAWRSWTVKIKHDDAADEWHGGETEV